MSAINKLLDKAAEHCSPANQSGLAARLGVTRGAISSWKTQAYALPAERIAELARIAQVDAGEWLVLIEAEQAKGEARKAYSSLVRRLGIAALLALAASPGIAGTSHIPADPAYYVNVVRKLLTRLARMVYRLSLIHV